MGIGNADGSPTSAGPQPRLLLWLDGSSAFPYGNNVSVDIWHDKSGNGFDFEPNEGQNPILFSLDGAPSGPSGSFPGAPATPAVTFQSIASDQMVCPDFEIPGDGYTIYFVIRTADNNYGLFSYTTPTSDREMLIYNDDGIRQQMVDTLDRSSAIGDLIDNQWNYGGILLDTSDDENWEYSQGAAYESGYNTFNGITFSNTGSAMIGDIQNDLDDYPSPNAFDGRIAEIFIYEGRLSRPATRLISTYLWVKYGISGAAPAEDWDKFYGDYNASLGGRYYAPIGIGNDDATPNGGSINEARSEGLVLRVIGGWTQGTSYLCAAPVGASPTGLPTNDAINEDIDNLPNVLERWERIWEISGNPDEGEDQIYQIAFDFGEGIEGTIPQNPENFVLLYRDNPISGNFSILPVADGDKFVIDDELVFRVQKSDFITPGRYYTIGSTDASSSLTGDIKRTWYAYQSGNWNDPLTWTLDGSAAPAYINPDGLTPAVDDNIFIGQGRTVSLNITTPAYDDLKVFGTLDLGSAPQPSFSTIGGSGLIRCSTGNFPNGNSSTFADPEFGGTLEFYGSGGFTQTTDLIVNKLKINFSSPLNVMTLVADLTTNGLFEVNRGSLIVNNTSNTSLVITSHGPVLVESQGKLLVSTDPGLTTHKWYFYDDLINDGGDVRFTNRTAADENFDDAYDQVENNDIIDAYFVSGNKNQELLANGTSYFSRIVIDKGDDITYTLTISSDNSNNFKLLGPCNTVMTPAEVTEASGNPNSFALVRGTAEIRENIFIPLMTNNGAYNINSTAQLWVNGGEVTKGSLGGPSTTSGIAHYGIIKVTDGIFNALSASGVTLRSNGLIQIDGGTLNTYSIRTSLLGPENIGGVIINGGALNVDGNVSDAIDDYYTFSLGYPGNVFRMTGGILHVKGATPVSTTSGLIFINSAPQNTSVTGGTVHLDISTDLDNYKISSRAAFWNLTLTRSNSSGANNFRVTGGTSGTGVNTATLDNQDLVVRNNLSISGPNNVKLEMGIEGDPADLFLHGDLILGNGCEYIHNNNTTHFVGTSNSSLTFGGSTTFPFFNVEVNKNVDERFVNIQTTGPSTAMDILGSLTLEKGYFVNNNKTVDVRGNITNRTQFGNATSTGDLRMSGTTGRQDIISDGGVFHSLVIDNSDGVTLLNDALTIKSRLLFTNGSFFIGDNKLRLETTNPNPVQSFNAVDEYIVCSGNASAGGVEILNHSDSQTLVYPIGVSTGLGQKYSRSDVFINSWPGGAPDPSTSSVVASGGLESVIDEGGSFYRIHEFTENGTISVEQGGEVEYLIVGGGGGGGSRSSAGGGGGAGGLLTGSVTVNPGSHNVVVGAGGFGSGSGGANQGSDGSESSIFSLTAIGGGGGGASSNDFNDATGREGGSGGGGGQASASSGSALGGSGTPGQGNNGGNAYPLNDESGAANRAGGGGGGAGSAGGNASANTAGIAGAGLALPFTGTSVTYATGGRGGQNAGSANNGIDGLGDGGDGSYAVGASAGGNGGAGIVIVKYEITEEEFNTFLGGGPADGPFIRITPVDTLLSTADISASPDFLNFYWKVSTSGYETKPNVTHRFEYSEDDVQGDEAIYESGRVLSELPFTRSIDNAPISAHVNTSSNLIYYNGPDQDQGTSGTGISLVDANYSAGAEDRFNGSPDVFFSNSTTLGAAWETPENWNKLMDCIGCSTPYDYHSTLSAESTTDYPESGDIAVIGFNVNGGSGKPHVYKAPPGGIEAAQIVFTPLQDSEGNRQPRFNGASTADFGILRPTLEISNTSDIIKVGQITGEGALMLKDNIDLGVTDIGGFLAEDSSLVTLYSGVPGEITMDFLPPIVPNLFLAEAEPTITNDIRVRGNLEVAGNSKLYLSETSGGNIEVDGDLILDKYQLTSGISPEVRFNKRGYLKTIHVHGDIKLLGSRAYIGINSTSSPTEPPEPWTPDEIDAFLWLDATEGVTTNGSDVTAWQDQASGTYTATQTDGSKRPLYQIGMNGLHTIRFDGVDDFLSIPHSSDLNLLENEDFEIFTVMQANNALTNNSNNFPVIYGKGQTAPGEFLLYVADQKYRLYMDGGIIRIIAPNNHTTSANLGWVRRQGNGAFLFNTIGGSTSMPNASSATNSGNTKSVSIGAAQEGSTRLLDGDIGEIILIKHALTNDERQKVEGFLAHKWGLENELPDGHPYKNDIPFVGESSDKPAELIVDGDIIQDLSITSAANNGLDLYNLDDGASFVNLVVSNIGTNEFINHSGPTPRLWKLTVDKGINTSSSFSFNSDVEIDGPSDEPEKAVNIQNGLLKFNDSSIDINLSSGGDNFVIPESGGLELSDGILSIGGFETGLLLSGSLNITGGSFNIGDTEGANNYIEYGGGSSPKISISGGFLVVGSQIRRNLSSINGALDYRQSDGDVIIGRYNAAEANRGMLEVLNPGSRFEHTGGSLTFVRGVNLGSSPSLLLTPATANVGPGSEIFIGNSNSPSGAAIQNFGIQSNTPLNSLTINSTNSPVVGLITNDLELNGNLTIQTGATLNCDNRNLILNQDLTNDGLLSSTEGTVSLIHPDTATVSGSGVFDLHDLERSGDGSGLTLVETDLLVKNDFTNDEGKMEFDGNTFTVKRNVTTDGILSFDSVSDGFILNGTSEQVLKRSNSAGNSQIDVLTINNNSGVTIPAGGGEFLINKKLRLEKGIFSLTGNPLEMANGSVFTPVNPFGENNMIVTGGDFANFGVKMNVPANSTDDIFVPLGIDRYMPVNLDFSQGSSGTTASSYRLRLYVGENGVVDEADRDNVLGMYFSVDGSNIGNGLYVDLKFRYNQQYVQVVSPNTEEDYLAARVLADDVTINKFGQAAVDEVNDILYYNIQGDFAGDEFAVDGDYFAGIDEAIPSTIPVYRTVQDGPVNDGDDGYDEQVPGGGAPSGALVIVESGDDLTFNIDAVNFYRTEIQGGAKIIIDETSQHRLGRVTGTGTLKVIGSGNLPAGDYGDFFVCGGGKLEYQAEPGDNFEVLSNMPPIEQVTLNGGGSSPGEIRIADNAVTICNDLIILGGVNAKAANSSLLSVGGNIKVVYGNFDLRQGNTVISQDLIITEDPVLNFLNGFLDAGNNGVLTVEKNIELGGRGMSLGTVFRETHVHGNIEKVTDPSAGSFQDGTGGAKLVLDGFDPQTITGDFTGTSDIPSLELNNAAGLTIDGNVDVSEKLLLTDGKIFTSDLNLIHLTTDAAQVEPEGGQPTSFVDGPMQWSLGATTAEKKFPVGKNDRFRPLAISNRSSAVTWEVEYSDTSASTVPLEMVADPFNVPAIETVSIQEFWRVETDASPAAANIGLSWGDNSGVSTSPSDQDNLLVLAYNDGTNVWESYGGQGFSYDIPTNSGSLNSSAPISFSERYITLGSSDELNPLPVTWLYFEGENKGKDNLLSWATSAEINNDYFKLERSLDAYNWTSIAEIEGAGMSNSMLSYTYTDQNAPFGRVYYRLRQVDYDGQMEFAPNLVSLERSFAEKSKQFDFLLFPNPTQLGTVRFRMSNTYDVRANVSIFDLSGKQLSQSYVQIDGQGTSAPVECNYEPGIYLVRVIVNDKMRSKPLVITR